MTGTAETEAPELHDIYGLEVVVVPPNAKSCRSDLSDLIYGTMDEKLDAIIGDIKACQKMQQPVLVGTSSIRKLGEYLFDAQETIILNTKFLTPNSINVKQKLLLTLAPLAL